MVLWIMENHEMAYILHTQTTMRRAVAHVLLQTAKCLRGVELTETVLTQIFHAVTLKG